MSVALITDYASLQAGVLNFLARADDTALSDALPVLIQLAEGELKDDTRVRSLTHDAAFDITADGLTMPTDYAELDSWYHDGTTYYGPIESVTMEQLADMKLRFGDTGVPSWVAITDDGTKAFFAPEPDATYTTVISYRRLLTALSASNTTNWLLTDHPNIYLYAVAKQAAKWLKDADAAVDYGDEMDKLIDKMYLAAGRKQFSGRLRGRPRRAIGG